MSIEILYVDRQLFPTVKVVYLSEITVTTLTFRDRTADVTYCADVTLFLHATSSGCHRFRHFYAPISCVVLLYMLFGLILGGKLHFHPIIHPRHAEQDQIDSKWLEVKFVF